MVDASELVVRFRQSRRARASAARQGLAEALVGGVNRPRRFLAKTSLFNMRHTILHARSLYSATDVWYKLWCLFPSLTFGVVACIARIRLSRVHAYVFLVILRVPKLVLE